MKKIADFTLEDVLRRKAKGRKRLSGPSFGEKVKIVEAMRVEADAFRRLRKLRASATPSKPR